MIEGQNPLELPEFQASKRTFLASEQLLFGIVALQNNVITREQLLAGFDAWVRNKTRPLTEILEAQNAIDADDRQLLERLVGKFVSKHGGDVEKSLASVSSIPEVKSGLERLADDELHVSLGHVGQDRTAEQDTLTYIGASSAGRFRILRPHAKGGLGQVSVALDQELNREVALKEILPSHLDQVSRERFVLEAEITGGLEHPGIVPVYALGQAPDGRPFYAMRFVKGDSLRQAIEHFHRTANQDQKNSGARQLELRQLLGRFIDVCDAIEYAHNRGVLHRDLKPGNIMVGKYGETLVVDWGLAKAMGTKEITSEEATLRPSSALSSSGQTQPGSAIGTPAYMSPEQASGQLHELGPTTDVYSLGATLYHLLTGKPPFDKADVGEILRKLQRGEFVKPRSVNPRIPQALESICLKAMAKLPEARYPTSKALASDIEHWLADEPVSALPESSVERAARWLRRHRAWARSAAIALFAVTLVSVIAVFVVKKARDTAIQLAKNNRQLAIDALASQHVAEEKTNDALLARNEKEQQRLRAVDAESAALQAASEALKSETTATQVTRFLRKLLVSADPMGLEGMGFRAPEEVVNDLTVRQLIDRAGAMLESDLDDQAEVRAAILDVLGNVYRGLGLLSQSEPLLKEALSLRQALFAGRGHPDLATSLQSLGMLRHLQGEYKTAEEFYRQALEMRQRLLPTDNPPRDDQLLIAHSQFALAWLVIDAGVQINEDRWAEAERLFQQTYDTRRQLLPPDRPEVVAAFGGLLAVIVARGPASRALQMMGEATAILKSSDGSVTAAEALVLYFRAVQLRSRRQYAEAEKLHRRVVEAGKRLLGEHHLLTMMVEADFAGLLMQSGQGAEADQIIERILAHVRGTALHSHPKAMLAFRQLARTRRDQGRPADAEALYVEILQVGRPRLGDRDPNIREAAWNLALLDQELGRFDGIEKLDAETVTYVIAICEDRAVNQKKTGDQATADLLERAASELRRKFSKQ